MKGIKKRAILIHLIGAVVARAAFFGINPLAIGYFTAACVTKAGGGLAFIAAMIGLATVMPATQLIKYALAMITSLIIMESPLIKKHSMPEPILYILPSLLLCFFSFTEAAAFGTSFKAGLGAVFETGFKTGFGLGSKAGNYALLTILEAVIGCVSAGIFKRGIDFCLRAGRGFKMNNEQIISMSIIIAIMIYAIPDFSTDYIAPVQTVVYFIILFFTYKYGVGQGSITGAVCGCALSLRGASLSEVGMFAMMGIIPAIFREMGRIPTATIYLITATMLGLFYRDMKLSAQEIGALISAVLVFLLLPGSVNYRVEKAGYSGRQELAAQNLKKLASTRMKVFSESFLKLSKTLDTITEKQTNGNQKELGDIFEDISEKLCKNCDKCSYCWEKHFQETYQDTCTMFDIAEKNGALQKEDIPDRFYNDCICAEEFLFETNHSFEIAKLNHIWLNRITESREVIANQLREVSGVIEDITGDIYTTALAARSEEDKISKGLRTVHIQSKDITVFERGDNRKEIVLSLACKGHRCITAREAAEVLSEALGYRVRVSDASKTVINRDYDSFIFIEDTKFKALTGVARAMKENISGDNFSVLKLETGEVMLALSDGMGTGKEAGEESETVMSLLEQMIEAGFKAETAIKLINSSLVLKSEKQIFSTIDLSLLDLFTGMCEFIKIGAAATFIKRDNWVETISSTTLPIGMLGNVDYDTVTKKLYEGDIIIMVTDGVLDSIQEENKEAFMERFLMDVKSSNPQEIANRILDGTLSQSNYVPKDDMTVICAGIWPK